MANAYGLRLGWPSVAQYFALSPTNSVVDASNEGIFAAHYTAAADAITAIGFRYGARTGTPPIYRVSIQSLDPATGNPDGVVLGGGSPASATFTPPADATWDGTWQKITLTNAYTPTKGQLIALVIDYSSGTINGANNSSFTYATTSGNDVAAFPMGGNQISGTWGNKNGRMPSMSYYTANGCYGNPIEGHTSTTYASNSTPDEHSLRFKRASGAGGTYVLRGFRFWTRGTTGATGEAVLYEGTTPLQTVTLDGDFFVNNPTGPADILFAAAETLNYGTVYRVAIKATNTTANAWVLNTINCDTDVEAAAFPGGPEFFLSSRTDAGAWTDDATRRPFAEIIVDDETASAGGGAIVPQGLHTIDAGIAA